MVNEATWMINSVAEPLMICSRRTMTARACIGRLIVYGLALRVCWARSVRVLSTNWLARGPLLSANWARYAVMSSMFARP
jgi:hypothetical protein